MASIPGGKEPKYYSVKHLLMKNEVLKYKGYTAHASFKRSQNKYTGKIIGLPTLDQDIFFEGKDLTEAIEAFQMKVDDRNAKAIETLPVKRKGKSTKRPFGERYQLRLLGSKIIRDV